MQASVRRGYPARMSANPTSSSSTVTVTLSPTYSLGFRASETPAQEPSVSRVWSMVWDQNGIHPQFTSPATIFSPGWRSKTPLKTRYVSGRTALKNRSEEHTSELQSRPHLVCRLLLEKKK